MIKLGITDDDFDGLQFVARAINKKHPNFGMTCIRVLNGETVATDGYRLHFYQIEDNDLIPDGFYEVIKNIKSQLIISRISDKGLQFPDIERAFPKMSYYEKIDGLCEDEKYGCSVAYTRVVRAMKENTVRFEYFVDVLKGGDVFDAYIVGDEAPVYVSCSTKGALIMPMRIK